MDLTVPSQEQIWNNIKVGDIVRQKWFAPDGTYDKALFEVLELTYIDPYNAERVDKDPYFIIKPLCNLGWRFIGEVGVDTFRPWHLCRANGLDTIVAKMSR